VTHFYSEFDQMMNEIMPCLGCLSDTQHFYETPEDEKMARMRNKQITKILKEYNRQEMKRLKLLLLGK